MAKNRKKQEVVEIPNAEEIEKASAIEEIFVGFNDRDRIYVETYCRFLSKTKAARAGGSTGPNVRQAGYDWYHRPKIKAAVKKYLSLNALEPEDVIGLVNRTAKTNISDYFEPVTTYRTVQAKVPLLTIIADLYFKIDVEDAYLMDSQGLSNLLKQRALRRIKDFQEQINQLSAEVKINPKAYRIQFVEKAFTENVLNVDRMVEDRVPLKSVKYTKEGIQVETYPADLAQERLLKINGSFEADNKQSRPVINNGMLLTPEKLAKLSDDELRVMAEIEKKLNA